ncbi:protein of unknown function [Pseudodesulfovibrio profundus]|uniref:Uncharacterized protein n=1 Tax=Pseudodesulfovibrio profundus TaxID=57320 RepID=A0A2C8FDR9_9BACT|nr:protein of unknown function [Pseudodesulfovibrio profundus]
MKKVGPVRMVREGIIETLLSPALIKFLGVSRDAPVEFECVACEKTIWVDEQVERTWKAYAEKPDPYDY